MGELAASTAIVVVNWNRWADSLECLEAILGMRDFSGPIVLVDNGSSDGSIAHLQAWADGQLCVIPEAGTPEELRSFVTPGLKPVEQELLSLAATSSRDTQRRPARLTIIDAAVNLGFAAANNTAIRYLLRFAGIDAFWLVNNDALPFPDAYLELKDTLREHGGTPMIFGNTLIEYWDPTRVQATGGRYQLWTGQCAHLNEGLPCADLDGLGERQAVDYPIGAGLLVTRAYVEAYGLMSEDFFLYYEEVEWVVRSGLPARAFCLTRSRLLHKGGASIAGGASARMRSPMSDYYLIRGRLLLARKLSVLKRVSTSAGLAVTLARRLLTFNPAVIANAWLAICHGIAGTTGRHDF